MRCNLAKIIPVVGILAGIIAIIFAVILFGMTDGFFAYSETYGGDAYTGIHEATAQTANNIKHLTSIARLGFGSLLLVIGIITICYFSNLLMTARSTAPLEHVRSEKNSETKQYSAVLENVAQNSGSEAGKWICEYCGSKNAAAALYCSDCGKSK